MNKDIGAVLKFIRVKAGFSHRQMAIRANMSPGTIQKFEAGTTKLSPGYLHIIREYASERDMQLVKNLLINQLLSRYYFDPQAVVDVERVKTFVKVIELKNSGLKQNQIARRLKLKEHQVQYIIDKFTEYKAGVL